MLSIIVASNRDAHFNAFEKSVANTVGLTFEIVRITELKNGLADAYNQGAANARFENLCFVHDDVLFHTPGWGHHVIAHLQLKAVGLIGVAGGRCKALFGTSWRDGFNSDFRMNMLDGVEAGKRLQVDPGGVAMDEVICLDGVFLCCTKTNWISGKLANDRFRGFHFYDLDFSLQMRKAGLANFVIYDVLIEHFSQGTKDEAFLNEFLVFQKKWGDVLPQSLEKLSLRDQRRLEGYALAQTLALMKSAGVNTKGRLAQLRLYFMRYKSFYHLIRSVYFGFIK